MGVMAAQDFRFRGDNYITKTVRVVSLAGDAPSGPPLHSYQILSKYSKGIEVMERTRMQLRTDAMLIAISLEPFGRGIKRQNIQILFVLSFK